MAREFHRIWLEKGVAHTLEKGEVVTVYNEGHPKGMWWLGRIEDLLKGADGNVRRVYTHVRVMSKRHAKVLRRPIQHIYPLEVRSKPLDDEPPNKELPDLNLEGQIGNLEADPAVRDEGKASASNQS